jgi:hypothetical protein
MKNFIRQNYHWFVVLILLFGCKESSLDDTVSQEGAVISYFDTNKVQIELASLNSMEQWKYVNDLMKKKYYNPNEFKAWVEVAIKKLCLSKKEVEVDLLYEVAENLYDLEFENSSFKISEFISKLPDFKQDPKARRIVGIIKSVKYANESNKDSLSKYLNLFEKSMDFKTRKSDRIQFYSLQGSLADLKGQYFEATVNYQKAIALTKKTDTKNLTTLYMNLATTYINLEHTEKANECAHKILEFSSQEDLSITNRATLAIIQSRVGDYSNSELNFKKVLDYAFKYDNEVLLAQTYANYGNLKRKQKQFDLGLQYMEKSDSICRTLGIEFGILINLINRAELYFDQGKFNLSAPLLASKVNELEALKIPKLNMEFYKLYYQVQDSLGNTVLADQFYRRYKQNHELHFGDLTRSVIVDWELATEKEQRIKEKTALLISLEKETKNKYLIAFLLTFSLFVIGIFYFFSHRKNHIIKEKLDAEKLRLSYELELKSKEMMSESMNSINIHNTKLMIYDELSSLIKELPATHQNKFKEFNRKLKATNKTNILDEFDARFTGVYEDFYQKILVLAPDLTPNELKICALLKLNISSKEISLLTNRSIGTIENTRVSIRKKFNLDPLANLQQYLISV